MKTHDSGNQPRRVKRYSVNSAVWLVLGNFWCARMTTDATPSKVVVAKKTWNQAPSRKTIERRRLYNDARFSASRSWSWLGIDPVDMNVSPVPPSHVGRTYVLSCETA